jgi:hypothetical protein
MMARKRKKRESPRELVRVAEAAGAVTKARPVRETVVIHTTRERKRNAKLDGASLANAAAMGGGSVAGGAASVVVAEQAKLSPFWAGVVTGGTTLALSQLAKKIPLANKALVGATLGAGGLCGVQLVANYYARKMKADQAAKGHDSSSKNEKRHADGDNLTRQELNDRLAKTAEEQKQTTTDLMTAFREEIKSDMRAVIAEMQAPSPKQSQPTNVIRVQQFRRDDEGYERNAYGNEDERNAEFADERNAEFVERDADPRERDASGDERDAAGDERDASGDERDASGDERDADGERDAAGDERDADPWERDASGDERDADPEWERNADERDAAVEERVE